MIDFEKYSNIETKYKGKIINKQSQLQIKQPERPQVSDDFNKMLGFKA